MKIRLKHIVTTSLIFTVLFVNTMALAATPREYTIQDVIEGVTGKSSELKRLDGKIKTADDNWIEADRNSDEGSGYEKDLNEQVHPLRAAIAIDDLKWERKLKVDELATDATELYYKIILQEKIIDYHKTKIERLQKQVEIKKLKISVGSEAAYTLITDETALKTAETELQRLINDEKNMKIQLSIKMNTPIKEEYVLRDSDVPFEEYKLSNIDSIVDGILKNYYTITSIDKKVDADIREKAINYSYSNGQSDKGAFKATISGKSVYKSIVDNMEDDLLKLKYDLQDEKYNLESKARSDYNNILNLKDQVETQKLEYEKNIKLSDAELAKFKAGQSIELDYKKTQEDTKNSLVQYNQAKLNYYISVEKFKDFIKYGVK